MENEAPSSDQAGYTVVARRYRPKSFMELIGQDHIAQALGKAINAGRVGHAYLFTGARGVGKTSTARIFAKSLNTPEGTEEERAADISQAIDAGEDMDVIEIDGASNRGIEEIRQLRANVNVRPSRSPFKIYIIDEVHMLTNQAFNALLKTLEEPPAHVKFIFCTTDPDKIPITVLSRCQRFDFVPVKFEAIQARLKEICGCEGFVADDEALALLARRAAGSMRDSQSLLEQVMSFSVERITVEQVHALLGTADEGRLLALVEAVRDNDALAAIGLVDEYTRGGADAGQLTEQLLGYLRDVMAVGVGGGPELLKLANPSGHENLQTLAKEWGVQTVLSAIQILDESLVRMRSSVAATTLLEVALVQICQLEQLASIPELLERVLHAPASPGAVRSPHEKKKPDSVNRSVPEAKASAPLATPQAPPPVPTPGAPSAASGTTSNPGASAPPSSPAPPPSSPAPAPSSPTPASATASASAPHHAVPRGQTPEPPKPSSSVQVEASSDALTTWKRTVGAIDGMVADFATMAVAVEPQGSDQWKIVFPPGAQRPSEYCDQAERRAVLQEALQRVLGRTIRLTFHVMPGEAPKPVASVPQSSLRAQKMRELSEHPYVKKLCEALDGEIIRVDAPREGTPAQSNSAPAKANG